MDLGLEPVAGVDCLFLSRFFLVFFFVDDIVVLYHRTHTAQVDDFQMKLFAAYEMRSLGELEWFLGIHIHRDRADLRLSLSQASYIRKLIAKFNINQSGRCPTPLPVGDFTKHVGQATAQEIHAYQQRIGSINFAAVIKRPDVAHAASKLSEFLTNPSPFHLECADRTLKYLGLTANRSIQYDADSVGSTHRIFLGSSDASFADDILTRYSSQGYAFMLFGGLIDWKANKQKTVTTSSTEAELLAVSEAAKELIWWLRFFNSINFSLGHTPYIQCDNRQTIRALTQPTFSTKLRHGDIHRHWLRQETLKGHIEVDWVASTAILADGLTKALPPQRHKEYIRLLGLVVQEGSDDKVD